MAKKKKTAPRSKSLFKVAASNKGHKAAKAAVKKAQARAKKAWKKALVAAKKKLRTHRRR
jgi:hypothetical protein